MRGSFDVSSESLLDAGTGFLSPHNRPHSLEDPKRQRQLTNNPKPLQLQKLTVWTMETESIPLGKDNTPIAILDQLHDILDSKSKPVHRAKSIVLNHHIRVQDQVTEDFLVGIRFEVEVDAAFAAVEIDRDELAIGKCWVSGRSPKADRPRST